MNTNTVLIFGDICPDNDFRKLFDEQETGPFSPELAEQIEKAKLVLANFECPATDNRNPITKCGPNLRAEPKDTMLLRNLGFDVLSLANNHILDYGIYGVEQTLEYCRQAGIITVGAGRNSEEAAKGQIVKVGEKRVGILSFAEAEFNLATKTAPGANHFDPYQSFDAVRELKGQSDFVIVLYHGGIEHYKYPSPLLQKKCRAFASAGADLILCQHSHCIGTVETYQGATILYGQGNTVFGYREGNAPWNEGLAASVNLETGEVTFLLLQATKNGVSLAPIAAQEERLAQMYRDSELLSDPEQIAESWSAYCRTQAAMDLPMLFGKNRVFNKLNRLLKNRLVQLLISRKKQRITMNLLRCEAHHEVVTTILEDEMFS